MLQLNNVVQSGKLLGKLLLVYTWYTFGEIGLFRPCGMKDAEPELISNMCLLLYPILLGFYGVYLYKYDAEKQQIKA